MSLLKTNNVLCLFAIALSYSLMVPCVAEEDLKQEFLEAHNEARNEVGVGPLVWDDEVAAYASSYANQRTDCAMVHSNGPYGENIAWNSGDMSAEDAAEMWIDEKNYYDYNSNTCDDSDGGTCLHYTQVVWRNTVRLGCAKVSCNSGGSFITCNYDPPGNYNGEQPY